MRAYTHELTLGFDFKNTNNNLVFGGTHIFDTSLDVSQFVLSYSGAIPYQFGRAAFEASLIASPGNMTSNNQAANFTAARTGADPEYLYTLLRFNHTAPLPKGFTLSNQFTLQLASGPLAGTEQLGFGGSDSVRGYPERGVNGDQGFIMNHELRTPALHPGRAARVKKVEDALQFLAFCDYGIAKTDEPVANQQSSVTLSSIGLGARYSINPYLSFRADYGWQLLDLDSDSGSGRFHIGGTISF